jgi:hypothetical protein
MKRLLLVVVLAAACFGVLLTPTVASAGGTSTADQIAQLQKAVATLQAQSTTQAAQIMGLQGQVTVFQAQIACKRNILVGTASPPSSSTGCVGDLYINTTTWVIYGPKTVSGWPAGVSLVGPKGATGATGAAGPIGSQGPRGDTGQQGLQGLTGATGEQGQQGLPGPKGDKGDPGTNGTDGAVGPAGANGATWTAASGLPTVGGKDGDLYLDTLNGDVYQNAQGTWQAMPIVNLKGPQGAAGPRGEKGASGADGIIGPVGPTGPQGKQGPAGADGTAGPQGLQGPKGDKGETGAQGPAGDISSYPGLVALAPYVRVQSGAITGQSGPNVVFSGANLFTQTDSGAYLLLGLPHEYAVAAPAALTSTLNVVYQGGGGWQAWATNLVWSAVSSTDLAGYCVYRRDITTDADTAWTKLTQISGTATTYEDDAPVAGKTYQYAVTSLDKYGGETAKTTGAQVTVPVVDHFEFTPAPPGPLVYQPATNPAIQVRVVDSTGATVTKFNGNITFDISSEGTLRLQGQVRAQGGVAFCPLPGSYEDSLPTSVIAGAGVTNNRGDWPLPVYANFNVTKSP